MPRRRRETPNVEPPTFEASQNTIREYLSNFPALANTMTYPGVNLQSQKDERPNEQNNNTNSCVEVVAKSVSER